jgi:hypothetical protein
MKDNHCFSLIIAAISLFFLLDGFAATAVSSAKDNYFIQKFDKDKDGKISKDEYPGSEASFKNRDKNNDGYLDENEAYTGSMSGRSEKEKEAAGIFVLLTRIKMVKFQGRSIAARIPHSIIGMKTAMAI